MPLPTTNSHPCGAAQLRRRLPAFSSRARPSARRRKRTIGERAGRGAGPCSMTDDGNFRERAFPDAAPVPAFAFPGGAVQAFRPRPPRSQVAPAKRWPRRRRAACPARERRSCPAARGARSGEPKCEPGSGASFSVERRGSQRRCPQGRAPRRLRRERGPRRAAGARRSSGGPRPHRAVARLATADKNKGARARRAAQSCSEMAKPKSANAAQGKEQPRAL